MPFDSASDGDASSFPPDAPATGRREGLPSSYRMRHDTHYVDHLTSATTATPIRMIAVDAIQAPVASSGDVSQLAASVARHGILQPLLVRARNGHYDLIAGRNRLAAARLARLREVPCVVHQADEAQAGALAEAERVRVNHAESPAPPPGPAPAAIAPALAQELTETLETVGTCLNLLPRHGGSVRERLARDLIRSEIDRGRLLLLAAQALTDEPILEHKRVNVTALLRDIVSSGEPASRLGGVSIALQCDPECPVRGDGRLLSIAFESAIRAMQALASQVRESVLHVAARGPAAESVVFVRLLVEGVKLPESKRLLVLDLAWPERPGGFGAALSLAAARHIARAQGGSLEAATEETGFVLTFAFPPA